MRNVKSFEDCNVLFRELYNQFDKLNSNDLNMEKRRAVNASPSKDLYDYVVRKELLAMAGKPTGETVTEQVSTAHYYTIVFTNSGTIRTSTYASGPYIFKRRSSSVLICVSALTPPGSDSARFNIWHNGVFLLTSDLVLPSGTASLAVIDSTDFTDNPTTFEIDDTLILSVTNGAGAQKVTVEVFVKEI